MHGLRIIYSSCIVCVAMYGVHCFVQQDSLPTVPYNVKHSIHAWQHVNYREQHVQWNLQIKDTLGLGFLSF